MVVMLKQCCCGCTLKTGALIIAVVFAILSGLFILVFSFAAADAADSLHYTRLSLEMHMEETENSSEAATEDPPHNTTYDDDESRYHMPVEVRMTLLSVWMWLSIFVVLEECGVLLINIFLMFAANKDDARLVFAWVLGFGALSCCFLVLQLIIIGLMFYASSPEISVLLLVIALTKTAGAGYSTLVGYSYHRQLVGTAVARRISRQDD